MGSKIPKMKVKMRSTLEVLVTKFTLEMTGNMVMKVTIQRLKVKCVVMNVPVRLL